MRKAYLVLADGTIYEGIGFGAEAAAVGELVFTTGMVGYLETLTDPSYAGQIVMQTFPLIGNYGAIEADAESAIHPNGYVVREWCESPSNFRSEGNLDAWLKAKGIPGICGLDTRAITRKIRENGVMNAMICSAVPDDLSEMQNYRVQNAFPRSEKKVYPAIGNMKKRVALLDCGAKNSEIQALQQRGCEVTAFPANASAEEILCGGFDGTVLSGGPGDPAENVACIAEIAKLLGKLPLFAHGLGHQMLAIAAGGKVEKMLYGHRGANQPVKEIASGRTHITCQNHGYSVFSIIAGEIAFVNANDGSCEGVLYPEAKALSVQFEPEGFLFDRFITMMGGEAQCR